MERIGDLHEELRTHVGDHMADFSKVRGPFFGSPRSCHSKVTPDVTKVGYESYSAVGKR